MRTVPQLERDIICQHRRSRSSDQPTTPYRVLIVRVVAATHSRRNVRERDTSRQTARVSFRARAVVFRMWPAVAWRERVSFTAVVTRAGTALCCIMHGVIPIQNTQLDSDSCFKTTLQSTFINKMFFYRSSGVRRVASSQQQRSLLQGGRRGWRLGFRLLQLGCRHHGQSHRVWCVAPGQHICFGSLEHLVVGRTCGQQKLCVDDDERESSWHDGLAFTRC